MTYINATNMDAARMMQRQTFQPSAEPQRAPLHEQGPGSSAALVTDLYQSWGRSFELAAREQIKSGQELIDAQRSVDNAADLANLNAARSQPIPPTDHVRLKDLDFGHSNSGSISGVAGGDQVGFVQGPGAPFKPNPAW